MPARKYNDELLNEAAQLREGGMPINHIARRLGMSSASVSWHCLRLGADSPNTEKNIKRPAGPMCVCRGNHIVLRFSEAEDRILLDLESQGLRICEIARELDRKPNSIRGRLMTLARQEERRENATCFANLQYIDEVVA